MEKASNPQGRRRSLELLHLDVPLISTRRSSPRAANAGRAPPEYAIDTSRRVPFLWERAPGVPKDSLRRRSSHKEEDFFPPKPPPGRWRLSREAAPGVCGKDDSNDGDIDSFSNDGSHEDEDVLSARIGKVSLPESSVIYNCGERSIADIRSPPSFIMNRFLPAANALAAHSTPKMPNHPSHRPQATLSNRLQRELIKSRQRQAAATGSAMILHEAHQQPQLPSKACGLQVFFPWTFKQAPCGVKSPIRRQAPRTVIWNSNNIFSDQRHEDNVSSNACKSPGWGLPFLDTSKLRRPRTGNEGKRERAAEFMAEFVGERSSGKPEWDLPRLRTPSEPWLQHILKNSNRRY